MSRCDVSRPGSCVSITMPRSPGSVPGSRALSSSAVWNPVAAMARTYPGPRFRYQKRGGSAVPRRLPQADDVALGVPHVGGEPHVADRLLRDDGAAAQP